jgi:hypothetical protein
MLVTPAFLLMRAGDFLDLACKEPALESGMG